MDYILDELKKLGAEIKSDKTNESGRFIVALADNPMKTVYSLVKALKPHFAHVSVPSYYSENEWSTQTTTKYPSLVGRGLIYDQKEFGEVTNITIRKPYRIYKD